MTTQAPCVHFEQVAGVEPHTTQGCEDCLRTGSTWVHLRLCMACGHVGCCDSSPNRHATRHNHATGHPVVASFEPGEAWMYCYPDNLMVETDRSIR
jgi:uncharacterized UBP type Zn finger protein